MSGASWWRAQRWGPGGRGLRDSYGRADGRRPRALAGAAASAATGSFTRGHAAGRRDPAGSVRPA
jgi:hypothetical protein